MKTRRLPQGLLSFRGLKKDSMIEQKEIRFWQIAAPMTFLLTFVFASPFPIAQDFFFLGILGVFLSARWKLPGSAYSLALVFANGFLKYGVFNEHHLWRWALEGSLGCSFFMVALSFEELDFSWIFPSKKWGLQGTPVKKPEAVIEPPLAYAKEPEILERPKEAVSRSKSPMKYWEKRARQDRERLQEFLAEMEMHRDEISRELQDPKD